MPVHSRSKNGVLRTPMSRASAGDALIVRGGGQEERVALSEIKHNPVLDQPGHKDLIDRVDAARLKRR